MRVPTPDILWTVDDVMHAVGGSTTASGNIGGISIDTRTLKRGDLFIALEGPNFDGHEFVSEALAKGATAAVVSRVPEDSMAFAPLIRVDDTLAALGALGVAGRDRINANGDARIIGVTGSVGKTSTKEALNVALGCQGRTHATEGSLNNHWGLPLSLARMPGKTEYGIFELGMNHPGEITPLSKMARPHVALVTTVEAVHSAHFDDVDAIADAKAEIFDGMEPDGIAILNRDNPYFHQLSKAAKDRGIDTILGFGADEKADVRLIGLSLEPEGSQVVADVLGNSISYRLGIPGRHSVINSLGVLAAVTAVGANPVSAAAALDDILPVTGRGERLKINLEDGPFTLIDESYNASPASMHAAIEVLGRMAPVDRGRHIAVLGDMLELGEDATTRHMILIDTLEQNGIDLVYTAGQLMHSLWKVLPARMQGGHAETSGMLAPMVTAGIRPGDVVTVKGSAGSRMSVVVNALRSLEHQPEGASDLRAANGE